MTANISIVTLGVENIAASTAFYVKLGWQDTTASQDSVTFLQGHSVVLGLYGRAALAEDTQIENTPTGFCGITLAINLPSKNDVDSFFAMAIDAGAHAQKKPGKVFWGGYSGYFADPDGHLWEVAFNPYFQGNTETGQLQLEPKS